MSDDAVRKKTKLDNNPVEEEIQQLLKLPNGSACLNALDALINTHGAAAVRDWRLVGKHPNTLIHEYVRKNYKEAVEHLVKNHQFQSQLNNHRTSDLCTPLHLAGWTKNDDLVVTLIQLGADPNLENKYGENNSKLAEIAKKKDHMVWLDLELTHLPADGPSENSILEIAVIITNKDLEEIERGSWVIHHEEKGLLSLSEWHQKTFKATSQGGNGLFDDVEKSTASKQHVEEEVLALLARHCPAGLCRLAGSSVHCDREVLLSAMPRVYKWCHHQIIDVSTVVSLLCAWQPTTAATIPPSTKYNHRAINDVESSVALMKWVKSSIFDKAQL